MDRFIFSDIENGDDLLISMVNAKFRSVWIIIQSICVVFEVNFASQMNIACCFGNRTQHGDDTINLRFYSKTFVTEDQLRSQDVDNKAGSQEFQGKNGEREYGG
jgi:hypothetical protein